MAWRDPIGFPSSWLAPAADSDGGRGGSVAPFVSAFPVDAVGAASPFRVCGWAGRSGNVCDRWTSHGSQPPGAWVIFAFSRPSRRGMEGPVRSMSRIPTEWPVRDKESASWVVMDDLPTPPLPERTWDLVSWEDDCVGGVGRTRKDLRARCA